MYTLRVSFDSGSCYSIDKQAETMEELEPRCVELDQQGWRWYIENDVGEQDTTRPCAIHSGIIAFLNQLAKHGG